MKSNKVDRDSVLPLYHQVLEKVRLAIRQGDYPAGGKIPPERELCRLLGVSRITIIKALNTLAAEGLLIKRVGLGTFVAEKPAFSLARGGAIGFVAPLLRGDTFFNDIVTGAERALSERDLSLVLAFSQGQSDIERRCLTRLAEQRIAGLILFMCDDPASWDNIRQFTATGTPVVLLDHRAPLFDESLDTVTSDNLKGAFLAVQHLVRLGHRRIGLVTFQKRSSSVMSREEGWRLALTTAGLAADPALIVRLPDHDPASDRMPADVLLALPDPPTALFAINDVLAIKSMSVLEERGVAIPEQFSVAGFDDNIQASLCRPPLTTVRQQRENMGRMAVELLVARLENRSAPPRHELLDIDLVVRGSTAPAPRKAPL